MLEGLIVILVALFIVQYVILIGCTLTGELREVGIETKQEYRMCLIPFYIYWFWCLIAIEIFKRKLDRQLR